MTWNTAILWWLGMHIAASLLVLTQATKSGEAFWRGVFLALEVSLFAWGLSL